MNADARAGPTVRICEYTLYPASFTIVVKHSHNASIAVDDGTCLYRLGQEHAPCIQFAVVGATKLAKTAADAALIAIVREHSAAITQMLSACFKNLVIAVQTNRIDRYHAEVLLHALKER